MIEEETIVIKEVETVNRNFVVDMIPMMLIVVKGRGIVMVIRAFVTNNMTSMINMIPGINDLHIQASLQWVVCLAILLHHHLVLPAWVVGLIRTNRSPSLMGKIPLRMVNKCHL